MLRDRVQRLAGQTAQAGDAGHEEQMAISRAGTLLRRTVLTARIAAEIRKCKVACVQHARHVDVVRAHSRGPGILFGGVVERGLFEEELFGRVGDAGVGHDGVDAAVAGQLHGLLEECDLRRPARHVERDEVVLVAACGLADGRDEFFAGARVDVADDDVRAVRGPFFEACFAEA